MTFVRWDISVRKVPTIHNLAQSARSRAALVYRKSAVACHVCPVTTATFLQTLKTQQCQSVILGKIFIFILLQYNT
jgi:BarA-like signal transduction histidine kinase